MAWVKCGEGALTLGSAEKGSGCNCSCICRTCENYKLKQCKNIERKADAVVQSS